MRKEFIIRLKTLLIAALLFCSVGAQATIIDFTAEGTDNMPNGATEDPTSSIDLTDPASNFFQVRFTSGGVDEWISQLTFDLQAGVDSNAFFDPSDADTSADLNGGGRGFGPVIGASTLGLSNSDISFSLSPTSGISSQLVVSFFEDSFNVGDIFTFGIDIDQLDGSLENQAGGLLGANSVGISAQIEESCVSVGSTNFQQETRNRSTGQLAFCDPVAIPEPATWSLLLMGMMGLLGFKGLKTMALQRQS